MHHRIEKIEPLQCQGQYQLEVAVEDFVVVREGEATGAIPTTPTLISIPPILPLPLSIPVGARSLLATYVFYLASPLLAFFDSSIANSMP